MRGFIFALFLSVCVHGLHAQDRVIPSEKPKLIVGIQVSG